MFDNDDDDDDYEVDDVDVRASQLCGVLYDTVHFVYIRRCLVYCVVFLSRALGAVSDSHGIDGPVKSACRLFDR